MKPPLLSCWLGLMALLTITAAATHYSYDAENRLAEVTYADGRQITYGYDAMGNTTSIATRNDSAPAVLVSTSIEGPIAVPIADYQVTVNRTAGILAYNATGLPAGLQINKGITVNADGKAPGVIYGTPIVGGVFRVALTAKSALGTGSPATLIVNIANPFTRIEDGYDVAGKAFASIPMSAISGGELGGSLTITVSSTGAFTGKLTLGTKSYAVKGQFDGQFGITSIIIDRPAPLSDLTLNLGLGLEGSLRGMLFGELREGATFANIDGVVSVWSPAHRATVFSGTKGATYNTALMIDPALVNNAAYPQGRGFAAVKITPAGAVALVGKLADGTAISTKSMVFWNGEVPIYLALYRGNGALTGTLTLSDGGSVDLLADNTVTGALKWQRLAMPGPLYPAGFPAPMTLNVFGGFHVPPPAGDRVLDLGNGAIHTSVFLDLGAGGLPADIVSALTISTGNKVTLFTPNNNSLALTFTPKSGLFSGKFTVPTPTRTTGFQGILIPASATTPARGLGYFLLPGATPVDPIFSGRVFVGPP